MHLTKRAIDAARYRDNGQSRQVLWDDDPRGLGLRVYPTNNKSFVLSYRTEGKKRLLVLGGYGALTLDQARKLAKEKLVDVIKGGDPVQERRQEKLGSTFRELAELYLKRHAYKHKKRSSAREDERAIKVELLPKWGDLSVVGIRRRDVIALLDAIVDRGTPVMANRVSALIHKMFAFAISRDIVDANPCSQIPRSPEQSRDRVLDDKEVRALWKAFEAEGPILEGLFKLRLLTLQRGAELAQMVWDEIDGDWWTIPAERTKKQLGKALSHRVPLSPQAQKVFENLRQYRHASGLVFPSQRNPDQYITSLGRAVRRVRKASEVSDFRPHDMRRTGATRLTGMGFARLVVAKILNHAESGVTHVYDRHSYDDEKRQALDAWGRYVQNIVAGKPGL
ncbi:MAG: integrase arm-type DNA-binding domain-containing protein, partial [Alphaproteobacteria bacterium]|nr:integrase arm-type DNA-binding domain-containing protein [Alphaproteobacteria bacterium]